MLCASTLATKRMRSCAGHACRCVPGVGSPRAGAPARGKTAFPVAPEAPSSTFAEAAGAVTAGSTPSAPRRPQPRCRAPEPRGRAPSVQRGASVALPRARRILVSLSETPPSACLRGPVRCFRHVPRRPCRRAAEQPLARPHAAGRRPS